MASGTIDEIFLIKDNGICYFHRGGVVRVCEDLRSAMIVAMDYGISEAFQKKIRCLVLEDDRRVVYHRCSVRSVNFTLITVLSSNFNDFIKLEEKVNDFILFLDEKNIFNYLDNEKGLNLDKSEIDTRISEKMKEFFLLGVEIAVSRSETI
jgi:hypothetical protein